MSSNDSNQHLTPEQNAIFDEIFATFATPGWKYLQRELENQRDAVANVRNTKDLSYTHGQLSVLDGLSNWKAMWDALYAGAKDGSIEIAPEFTHAPRV